MKWAWLAMLAIGCFGCGSTAASSSGVDDAGMEAAPFEDRPDVLSSNDLAVPDVVFADVTEGDLRERSDGGPESCATMHIDCFGGRRICDPQTGVASEQIKAPINCPWNEALGRCSCNDLSCAIAHYTCADGCRTDPGLSTDDGGTRPPPDGGVTTSGPEVGSIFDPQPKPWLACREYAPTAADAGPDL
jgi:hypothetical protein